MKKKILIVDDEAPIRLLYKEELEDAGYDVATAEDFESGFKKIKTFIPDLVILDIKMPGTSGLEALQKYKNFNSDLKIILCSAYSDFKNEFVTWAADDYIVKSSDLSKLKEKIGQVLNENQR